VSRSFTPGSASSASGSGVVLVSSNVTAPPVVARAVSSIS
jgi:hypothetical protein